MRMPVGNVAILAKGQEDTRNRRRAPFSEAGLFWSRKTGGLSIATSFKYSDP